MDAIAEWIMQYGYIGLFGFLMLGIVGVPLPEDLMLAGAGYLVFKGYLKPAPTVAAAFLGSLFGITVSYGLGRLLGMAVVAKHGYRIGITRERLDSVISWYARFGRWTLVFGYYIGGFRHVNALLAGALKLPLLTFGAFAYSGAFLWTVSLITAGFVFGEEWTLISGHIGARVGLVATLAGVVALFYLLRRKKAKLSALKTDQLAADQAGSSEETTEEERES